MAHVHCSPQAQGSQAPPEVDPTSLAYWRHQSYTYVRDNFPATILTSQWFTGHLGMYRDGMDFIGQRHPVFIVQTQMRHFQHELVRNEIFDTVSLFNCHNEGFFLRSCQLAWFQLEFHEQFHDTACLYLKITPKFCTHGSAQHALAHTSSLAR